MEKRRENLLTLRHSPEADAVSDDGGSAIVGVGRAELIHSIYQLALDPHFYDTFMEQWDDHVGGAVAALSELKAKATLDDAGLVAHFDRAFGILEELGRKPPSALREGRGPRVLIAGDGSIVWHNRAAAEAFGLCLPAHLEDIAPSFQELNLRSRLLTELPAAALVDPDAFQLLRAELHDKPFFMLARAVDERSSERAILLEPLVGDWNSEAASLLARGFGLTGAEVEIAAALTEGNTPAEIAEQRDVALSTVRSQIKALLAKTGAASQTDLVRLLASLSRVIEPRDPEETPHRRATFRAPTRRQIPVEFYGAPEGRPVLFLHGMLDGLSSTPRLEWELKRRGLRVIAPARPGFGAATPFGGPAASAPSAFARDIEWLLDELHIREVQLLGHMAGGFYSFALAAHLGDRVKRIVNVAGAVPILSTAQFASMSRRQRLLAYTARYTPAILPFVARGGARQLESNGDEAFARALYEDSPADLAMLSDPDVFCSVRSGFRFTIAQGHRGFATDAYHIVRDWSELAMRSKAPVTLIHGRHDPVVRSDTVEGFARRLGGRATLEIIEGAGQLALFSAPERVCKAFD